MNNKNITIVSIALGIIIISWAVFFIPNTVNNKDVVVTQKIQKASVDKSKINLGELDSSHDHASLVVFINGERINLAQEKYMLRDKFIHLEDGNGVIVHKHATGATLQYFFSTLGMELTNQCLTLDTGMQYCNSKDWKKLKIIVNGKEIIDIDSYEPRHKDKILIDYGNDSAGEIMFKFNNVPDVPEELL